MDASHSEPKTAVSEPQEIVVTIRRRRARPDWSLARVLGWSIAATAGNSTLLLVPFLALSAWLVAALGIGAPAHAEVIVPALSPPPADAFQDIGVLKLTGTTGAGIWIGRGLFALARVGFIALLAALAVQRARAETPDLPAAARMVRAGARTVVLLGASSFGWALWVAQQSSLDPNRDATIAATALAFGMLFFPGAFVAAADGAGFWRALGRGFGAGRPAGHIVLVLAYGAALNGLYRLASFGEPAGSRPLPLTLYAFVAAFLTSVFMCALARRTVLRRGGRAVEGREAV